MASLLTNGNNGTGCMCTIYKYSCDVLKSNFYQMLVY